MPSREKQYSTEELEKLSLEAIEKYRPIFFKELCVYLPIERETFYKKYNLHRNHKIKSALRAMKVKMKNHLRKKWYESDNPTLQLCLYRLLADGGEHRKLNTNYTDVTTKGDKLNKISIEIVNVPAQIESHISLPKELRKPS